MPRDFLEFLLPITTFNRVIFDNSDIDMQDIPANVFIRQEEGLDNRKAWNQNFGGGELCNSLFGPVRCEIGNLDLPVFNLDFYT